MCTPLPECCLIPLVMTVQTGSAHLARSRSGNSRARGRRPARSVHLQASPDGNVAVDGIQPASSPGFAKRRAAVLTSPFAAAAAAGAGSDPSLASSDEGRVRDNIRPEPAATEEVSVEGGSTAAKPATAFGGGQSPAGLAPGVRTSSGARQEQDYAIVEAPASLRRRSSVLPPQEDGAQQEERHQAVVGGGNVGDELQFKTSEGSDRPHHTGLPAAPSAASTAARVRMGSTAPAQRETSLSTESVAAPNTTGDAADITAGLERLRMSGARSGIGGTDTAGSTPVSFTSAAST